MTFHETTKKNVSKFEKDVVENGSYIYTKTRLSSQLANRKISEEISQSYLFKNKNLIDVGCGDGTYTIEFTKLEVQKIVGIDPAQNAINTANEKALSLGINKIVHFKTGNIYSLDDVLDGQEFDCAILRGVLHHLPDASRAIKHISTITKTIIILEPNGYNPILKLLERFSTYHIEHEEKSFSPSTLEEWVKMAGFQIESKKVFNLVPFFCPDWLAKTCKSLEPIVERIPVVRYLCCGQIIIVAKKI